MDATGVAARAIRSGKTVLITTGGVESMSYVPFVMGKVTNAFSHDAAIYSTITGWRFIDPLMKV